MKYVLATTNPPRIFNFYPTTDAAQEDMPRASKSTATYGWGPYAAMSYEAYKAAERHFYLAQPAYDVTADTFEEMLGVLPPLHYEIYNGFTSFLMSEFFSGPYTHQYAACNGRCYCKMVDATDRSTWMTLRHG